ncbi:MAG: type II toxin-antitoxin system VapB family antitoxin [Microcystaceae cyanobacterium]
MNLEQAILIEIRELPIYQQQEVLDFTQFLKYKQFLSSSVQRSPLFGSDKGKIHISDNFDEPLEDFQDYM